MDGAPDYEVGYGSYGVNEKIIDFSTDGSAAYVLTDDGFIYASGINIECDLGLGDFIDRKDYAKLKTIGKIKVLGKILNAIKTELN